MQDQYIELSTALPASASLYGLGESVRTSGFELPRNGTVLTLWARDSPAALPNQNIYSAWPFYMDVRAGSCLLWLSSSIDYTPCLHKNRRYSRATFREVLKSTCCLYPCFKPPFCCCTIYIKLERMPEFLGRGLSLVLKYYVGLSDYDVKVVLYLRQETAWPSSDLNKRISVAITLWPAQTALRTACCC